jgi:hypothetical protein
VDVTVLAVALLGAKVRVWPFAEAAYKLMRNIFRGIGDAFDPTADST